MFSVVDASDEAQVKATSLFRNQLLRPVNNTPPPPTSTNSQQLPQSSTSGKNGENTSQFNILQLDSRVSSTVLNF